jgi:hypothetical protein
MPLTRTRRRILIAVLSALVFWPLTLCCGRALQCDGFYDFLGRHELARQTVRPFSVVAGKQKQFDGGVLRAAFRRILRETKFRDRRYAG